VNKVFAAVNLKQMAEPVTEEKKEESFVYFRADRKMVKVMLDDILYIESMKDYIKVFTRQAMVITKQSISSVEAMLPEKEFIRVHRSYIVSLNKIRSFTTELLEIGKTEIPIGKLYRNEVRKVLS
jgi:DNA-binding LytR/AlgR family response regulator